MGVLLAVAALVVAAPIAAAVLVTLASHREDFSHSIGGRPPGLLAAAARALLCLRIGGRAYPRRPSNRPPDRPRGQEFHRSDDRTLTLPRS
jgi:fructose-1,6-bisphosphatase/sedoheptulose 1,7-bisphosphatase-like protein